MKTFLTYELLPILQLHFRFIGREYKSIFDARRITILLFALTTSLAAQSTNNIPELYPYDKAYFENDFTQSTDSNLTFISQLGIGPCYDAVVVGNYAYVGNGALFQVLDISDPLNPILVGEVLTPGVIYDIEIYGNYALLVTPFTVIDISDPYDPFIAATLQTTGGDKLRVEGNYGYIGAFSVVYIIDISNPLQPQRLSTMLTSGEMVLGVAVKEPYLYISTYDGMVIDIYDVSDKNNPIYIGQHSVGTLGGDLCIKDNYLYAGFFNFSVYDITNPTQLVYIGGVLVNALTTEIEIKDTLAYISSGGQTNGGLTIVSVTNPYNLYKIVHIKSVNSPKEYFTSDIQNNLAYLSSGVGLDIFDMTNLVSPEYLNSYLTSWETTKMKVYNDLLYLSGYNCGFKIIDYSDPVKLKVLGQYQEKTHTKDFDISDTYVYLLTDYSIIILNMEDPLSPYKINEIVVPDSLPTGGAILVKDSILIVSFPASYLTMIDVSDPLNPIIIDSVSSGTVRDLAISDDYLFSAEGFDGLTIYKSADSLYKIKTLEGFCPALIIEDSLLCTYFDGFSIYNISNPKSPSLLGTTSIPGDYSWLEISKSGDYVSLGYYYNLEVIDVSNPYNPFIAAYSRDERITAVASISNLIFAGNQLRGIKVFKNDLITSMNNNDNNSVIEGNYLFQNYPNPFNSNTTIKYSLTENAYIKLKLYDILGNEVMTIEEGFHPEGIYTLNINTENLSSGVYLYRLITDNQNITKKLILLK